MSIASLNDINSAIAAGRLASSYFTLTVGSGSNGSILDTFIRSSGSIPAGPVSGTLPGTAKVAVAMDRTTPGALDLNANVSSSVRQVLSVDINAVNSNPGTTAILVDMLLYYPSCPSSNGSMTNTATLPRYTDGKGVMGYVAYNTAGATPGASAWVRLDKTNDLNNTGGFDASGEHGIISDGLGSVHPFQTGGVSGGNTNGCWFASVGAGATGIKQVNSYTVGSNFGGTFNVILCKPLLHVNIGQEGCAIKKFGIGEAPIIQDGACLNWLFYSPQTSGTWPFAFRATGSIRYIWG